LKPVPGRENGGLFFGVCYDLLSQLLGSLRVHDGWEWKKRHAGDRPVYKDFAPNTSLFLIFEYGTTTITTRGPCGYLVK
jgi:hypothetical protein